MLTEASPKKRASIHMVEAAAGLAEHNPGGLEVLDATLDAVSARLRVENHTLKRSLASPKLFSGIGNAYSDEILHAGAVVAGAAHEPTDRRRRRAAVRGDAMRRLRTWIEPAARANGRRTFPKR